MPPNQSVTTASECGASAWGTLPPAWGTLPPARGTLPPARVRACNVTPLLVAASRGHLAAMK
eukprot:1167339-Prorocentrum_minimum.AAC.1